jgi:uncharacterized damage-inducible protein DinB
MNLQEALRGGFERAKMVTDMLLGDLSDAEILERPVPEANHVAWQLGHLVTSLNLFGEAVRSGCMPALPEGFAAQHSRETAGNNDPAAFHSKSTYLRLLDEQRAALLKLMEELPESRFAEEAPESMRSYAPRIVDLFELASAHELMHSGQITVLRRRLGRSVAF